MNTYGKRAQQAWQQLAPSAYAQIPDPNQHFSTLGREAQNQIADLTTQLAGPDEPGESFEHKVGRLNSAKMRAEEIVAADLLIPPREEWDPTNDPGDEPDEYGQAMMRALEERLYEEQTVLPPLSPNP